MTRIVTQSYKPSREEIQAAQGRTIPDVIAPGLKVLFCGINPGLYSGAVQHHFARPGNRFWKALYDGGFTPRLLLPFKEKELLQVGYGITNLVEWATARAEEIPPDQLAEGKQRLTIKVLRYQPQFLALLGIGAYRSAFRRPQAEIGRQKETIGKSELWVLPNPSGLNSHYQPKQLKELFGELRQAVGSLAV
jgi:double-stranded uracil-DNA glycosylase